MNKNKFLAVYAILALCLLNTSCIDNSYDLDKDIDMNITIGGDEFTLPVGSTEAISLKEILDLDDAEKNTLKTNNGEVKGLAIGDYYLKEDASPQETYIDIQAASVKLGEEIEEKEKLTFPNPQIIGEEQLEALTKLNTSYKFHNESMPSQLRKLNWIELSEPTHLSIYFESEGINQLTMKEGMEITFPEYVTMTDLTTEFYTVNKNKIIVTKDTQIGKNGTVIDFNICKIDFTDPSVNDNFFTPSTNPKDLTAYGILDLDVNLKVRGYLSVKNEDFASGVTIADATIGAKITFDEATIQKGNVQIAPNFEVDIEPIDFVDVPDFLKNEDTYIDLHDPKIYLHVNNPAPIGVNITADMMGLDENGNLIYAHDGTPAAIHIGNSDHTSADAIYIPAATETILAITRLPHTYGPDTTGITIPTLSNLVERIPSKIAIENLHSDVPPIDYTIEFGKRYTVTADYAFITPLAFGENLNLVYQYDIDGWSEDMDDIKIKHAEIELGAINEIPMGMTVNAKAKNTNGNTINNVSVEVTGNINAGKQGSPANGNILITMKSESGDFSNFNGIELTINGKSSPTTAGTSLNENQTLQLKNIKLRIKEGITMNLN